MIQAEVVLEQYVDENLMHGIRHLRIFQEYGEIHVEITTDCAVRINLVFRFNDLFVIPFHNNTLEYGDAVIRSLGRARLFPLLRIM